MSDKDLLETAAKAAGVTLEENEVGEFYSITVGRQGGRRPIPWNPLTDDGDALRLAVKLKIDFRVYGQTPMVGAGLNQGIMWVEEIYTNDPYAATRRAIVRAAATIAQSKGTEQ